MHQGQQHCGFRSEIMVIELDTAYQDQEHRAYPRKQIVFSGIWAWGSFPITNGLCFYAVQKHYLSARELFRTFFEMFWCEVIRNIRLSTKMCWIGRFEIWVGILLTESTTFLVRQNPRNPRETIETWKVSRKWTFLGSFTLLLGNASSQSIVSMQHVI